MNFDNILTSDDSDYSRATLAVYDLTARDYVRQTGHAEITHFYDELSQYVRPGATLLDLGCGSGRDAVALTKRGLCVDVLEPSLGLRNEFHSQYPDFPGKMYAETFQTLALPRARYDLIYASASLHHVPLSHWPTALSQLRQAMKTGGIFYVSLKVTTEGYDAHGRWFNGVHDGQVVQGVVENAGFKLLESNINIDALGRANTWLEAWFEAL